VSGVEAALEAFESEWVAAQEITPRIAYARTLRLLRFYLDTLGKPVDDLTADDLEQFVAWHAASGLADDPDGSRKIALHVARIGADLAVRLDRPELAVPRDRLRAAAGHANVTSN
jgi:hypothetical protein